MSRISLLMFLFSAFTLNTMIAAAQSRDQKGYIKLRNGWNFTGRYHLNADGSVVISAPNGDGWTIPATDIESIKPQRVKNAGPHQLRFGHYTEIGALAATRNRPDNVTTAAFSFQVVNGVRFRPAWFAGIGTGVDLYATQTTLPVFASLRGDLFPGRELTPYFFTDLGQGFDITSSSTSISYRGGAMFAVGLGLKVHVSERTSFHVQAGYRLQRGSITENGLERNYDNHRLALRAGFCL